MQDWLEADVETSKTENNVVSVNVENRDGQVAEILVKSESSQAALDELGSQNVVIAATTRAMRPYWFDGILRYRRRLGHFWNIQMELTQVT